MSQAAGDKLAPDQSSRVRLSERAPKKAAPGESPEIAPTTRPVIKPAGLPGKKFAPPPELQEVEIAQSDQSSFGISAFLLDEDPAQVDRKIEALVDLGAKWVRMEFRWATIQAQPDTWRLEREEYAVAKLKEKGISVLGVIAFTPSWASSAPSGTPEYDKMYYPPADPRHFREVARVLSSKFKDSVSAWQLWTEPDHQNFWQPKPDPKAYAELLKNGREGLNEGNPEATAVYAGVTYPQKTGFLASTLAHGAADYFDVMATHSYSNSPEGNIKQELLEMLSLSSRYKREPVPIWVTEIGWSTYIKSDDSTSPFKFIDPVTEREQATFIGRRLIYLAEQGVEHSFVYELNEYQQDPSSIVYNFGLMDANLTPKPAYYVFKHLNKVLQGRAVKPDFVINAVARRQKTLETHAIINSEGKLVLAVWDNSNQDNLVDLSFVSDDFTVARELNLADGTLAEAPFEQSGARHEAGEIKIGAEARVFIFDRAVLKTSESAFSPNGDRNKDIVEISYFAATASPATIEITGPGGLKVRTIAAASPTPGPHKFFWDGRDDSGRLVDDGRYMVVAVARGRSAQSEIIVDRQSPAISSLAAGPGLNPNTHRFEQPYFSIPVVFSANEPVFAKLDVYDNLGRLAGVAVDKRIRAAGANSIPWYINYFSFTEGLYWFKFTAVDAAGNSAVFYPKSGINTIHLDLKPPKIISAGFERDVFTPNGDGLDDRVEFSFALSEICDTQIFLSKDGKKYYIYAREQVDTGKQAFSFDGRATEASGGRKTALADGRYHFSVLAVDPFGNIAEKKGYITIADSDYEPVRVKLKRANITISPNADGRDDSARIDFSIDKKADAVVSLIDLAGREHFLWAGAKQPPGNYFLYWDGQIKDPGGRTTHLPGGRYRFKVSATDLTGNNRIKTGTITIADEDFTAPRLNDLGFLPNMGGAFRPGGRFTFNLSETAGVTIKMWTTTGRVYSIAEQVWPAGKISWQWTGAARDNWSGVFRTVPPGLYHYELKAVDRAGLATVKRSTKPIAVRGGYRGG